MYHKLYFQLTLAIFLPFIAGCLISPSLKKDKQDKELEYLISAYEEHEASNKKLEKERLEASIKELTVNKIEDEYVISCNLQHATITSVFDKLFEKVQKPYLLKNCSLDGRVTTYFKNLPLLDALNVILEPYALKAELLDEIIIIKTELENIVESATGKAQTELTIRNLDMNSITNLLNGLYPVHLKTGERAVNFGFVSQTNKIYLSGAKADVENAIKVITAADSEIKHIMLEALLVEFNSNDFKKIDANISGFSNSNSSEGSLNFGSFSESSISLTRDSSASNPTRFTAIMDILMSEEKARLISRPFVSTLSGTEALINITNDRFVITETAQQGATIVAPSPITSGVVLKITPTILADDVIRMDMYIEDSQFVSPLDNVAVEVDRNSATTRMDIDDGKTIIIGGLVSNRRTWGNAGAPWLRKIPILNILFAKKIEREDEREMAIYLTPHIWDPSIDQPLLKKDSFSVNVE